MTDAATRTLELQVAAGDMSAMDRLKAAWARSAIWKECPECQARVPELAWARHQRTHEYQFALTSMTHVTAYLGGGGSNLVAGPMREERRSVVPLWHRIVINPGQDRVRFFRDREGESNMPLPRGHLPHGYYYYVSGLSLIPDRGTSEADAHMIYNEGCCWLLLGRSDPPGDPPSWIAGEYPARALVPPSREFMASEVMPDPTSELAERMPECVIAASGRSLEIPALMTLSFDLFLRRSVSVPVGLMAVFHGIRSTTSCA